MKIPTTYPHLRFKCIPQRYVVALECFLILMGCYMLRYSLSFAMPRMTKVAKAEKDVNACPYKSKKHSKEDEQRKYEFHWTAEQQGIVHGSFFYGYIITQLIGGVLSDVFNYKVVMLFGYVATIIFVVASPVVTRLFDYLGLTVLRFCVGLAQGLVYNTLFAATANWVPFQERAILTTLIFTGIHMGNVINGWFTGWLMKNFEWPLGFYVYGVFGMFVAILFCFTTYSYPSQYPSFSPKEQAIFDEHRTHIEKTQGVRKKIPLKAILTNIHVWAIFLAVAGEDWALYTFVVYLPSYLTRVQHISIDIVGFISGTAFLLLFFYAMASAPVADFLIRKNYLSITWTRKILYLIATVGCFIGFLLVAFAGCNEKMSISGILIGYPIMGLYYPSIKVNAMDLSPNYAATIGSIGNSGGCISGLIVPVLVGHLTTNSAIHEWRLAFLIAGVVVISSGILFFLLSSGNLQKFDSYGQEEQR